MRIKEGKTIMSSHHLEIVLITICVLLNVIAYYWDNPRVDDE